MPINIKETVNFEGNINIEETVTTEEMKNIAKIVKTVETDLNITINNEGNELNGADISTCMVSFHFYCTNEVFC